MWFMRILLGRHGDTAVTAGHFHGMTDHPLSSTGRHEAEQLAERIKHEKPSTIYTSHLKRNQETAKIVGDKLGVPVYKTNALGPLDNGIFDGQPNNKENTQKLRQYLQNPNEKFPQGESVNDWAQRYLPFLTQFAKDKSDDTVMFVTHGRNIVLTKAWNKLGQNGTRYDQNLLANNTESTDHGGYSVLDGNKFTTLDSHKVPVGQS